jgi:hypothetical protein
MDNYTIKLAQLLQNAQPEQGGLSVGNYPNPFQNPNANGGGLRAYKNDDGTYGGQMMPKYTGWMGVQTNPKGQSVTELSIGDNIGDFPSIVPTLNKKELNEIVQHEKIMPSARQKAQEWADLRRSQGLSPFKDIWDK